MAKRKTKPTETPLFWRIVISLIGFSLILMALSTLALSFWGVSAIANVSTRRVGGSDPGRPANQRYEWSVSYTFRDASGKIHNGHSTKRGGDMGVTIGKTVRYFPFAPYINALEKEATLNWSQPLYFGLGYFLIVVMNRKKKKKAQTHIVYRRPDGQLDVPTLNDYDDSVESLYDDYNDQS
jgi:hypothetical protein